MVFLILITKEAEQAQIKHYREHFFKYNFTFLMAIVSVVLHHLGYRSDTCRISQAGGGCIIFIP
jgi:hypothetical protein